jgi:hypothetical protein
MYIHHAGNGFEFINQSHYDLLGELVIQYIYQQLKDKYGVCVLWVVLDVFLECLSTPVIL